MVKIEKNEPRKGGMQRKGGVVKKGKPEGEVFYGARTNISRCRARNSSTVYFIINVSWVENVTNFFYKLNQS